LLIPAILRRQHVSLYGEDKIMRTGAHLWAIGYDDMARADRVREEITKLGWGTGGVESYLLLDDVAVVVRHPDGSFTLNREPLSGVGVASI
jgi:uncharacterized membrane protein